MNVSIKAKVIKKYLPTLLKRSDNSEKFSEAMSELVFLVRNGGIPNLKNTAINAARDIRYE
jgi:hypothetical protein